MSRAALCSRIEEQGMVPVLRLPSAALVYRAVEALLAAGVSVFEVTLTVPGAIELIASLVQRFGPRATVGAGTVLSPRDAEKCIEAGAMFIVSPGFDRATLEAAHARDVPVMPGALTPTEVISAWNAGADMVKIFPCSAVGGPKYVRALKGPLPQVKMLPTGGVSLSNVGEYIAAGAAAVGMGSELVDRSTLESGRDAELTELAHRLATAIRTARSTIQ
jgi:2-dehydro-3-deoxyphosphogluconate aldolase/(4S)-4-hydroxy-2-oxoglutarate aldolase